jgi:aryl-alcohol dehydrogenase-like predicted oxidoreductase
MDTLMGKRVPPCVEYNWLGPNCGLKVSNLCLGTMTFGKPSFSTSWLGTSYVEEKPAHEILDCYYELGGNFIDTANNYNGGESEAILGSWLSKHDRSSVIISTKVRFPATTPYPNEPNDHGLSRGSIFTNIDRSLRRLGTDYIDIYYAHCWDSGVKLEETLRAFDDLVRIGKVRYVGFSNLTGAQLQKVVDYNKFMGFNPCVVVQQEYNLLEQNCDIEVVPVCKSEGVTLIPYTALKGGLLTGKFKRNDRQVTSHLAGSRMGYTAEKPVERENSMAPNVEDFRDDDHYWTLMAGLQEIGKAHSEILVVVMKSYFALTPRLQ